MKLPVLLRQGGGPAARSQGRPSRGELLALRPLRNPELPWCEEAGQVVLTVKGGRSWKARVLSLLFPMAVPANRERRVALDAIGTDVWRMMDGQHSISQIARSLAKEYKLLPQEAEISLQQHLRELLRRGYIMMLQPGPLVAGHEARPQQSRGSAAQGKRRKSRA